ncbi:MAG: hypothetical protein AAFS03_07115 [Pseudomonadota bacterium]
MIRVMAEADDEAKMNTAVDDVAEAVRAAV